MRGPTHATRAPRALLALADGRTVEVRIVLRTLVGDRWRSPVEWSEGAATTHYQRRWAEELTAIAERERTTRR